MSDKMKIRAYNCQFGDCYCIFDSSANPLYVDFGIHRRCGYNSNRYDSIIKDIKSFGQKDFLLTHYHEDHYSGLIRMMENNENHKTFGTVYLPFIPLDDEQTKEALLIIKLILTNGILRFKNDIEALKKLSFIRLLDSVYKATNEIVFLKKGNQLRDKYKVLWPEIGIVVEDINRNNPLNPEVSEGLHSISIGLLGVLRNKEDNRLRELQDEYISFASKVIKTIKFYVSKTNNISNEHCIVFHNIEEAEGENILFTGDLGKKRIWDKLERELHSSYFAIKIPHHGTAGYYHDFTNYVRENSYMLIPNGRAKGWEISGKYPESLHEKAFMVCNEGCICQKRICICTNSKHVGDDGLIYADIST